MPRFIHSSYHNDLAALVTASNTAVNHGADTLINYNNVVFDRSGIYDTTNKRYYAKVRGVYHCKASIRLPMGGGANNGRYDMVFRVNGTPRIGHGCNQTNSNDAGFTITAIMDLGPNDYVDVLVNQNSGANQTSGNNLNTADSGGTERGTHFFCHLLQRR